MYFPAKCDHKCEGCSKNSGGYCLWLDKCITGYAENECDSVGNKPTRKVPKSFEEELGDGFDPLESIWDEMIERDKTE